MIIQSMPYPDALVLYEDGALLGRNAAAWEVNALNEPIVWQTEVHDNGGYFDPLAPKRLTIPTGMGGLYRVAGAVYAGVDGQAFGFLKNGSAFEGSGYGVDRTGGNNDCAMFSAILSLAAGDYMEMTKDSTLSNTPADTANWFAIERLDASTKYCVVRKSGNQSFTANVAADVTFDTEVADVGGWFPGSGATFTVPSGVTRIRITAAAATGSYTGNACIFLTNGAGATIRGLGANSKNATVNKFLSLTTAVLSVTPGDTFKLQAALASSSTISTNSVTWLCIEEVPNYARTLVYRSSDQSLSALTTNPVAWNAAAIDTASAFNSTNGTIEVPSGVTQMRLSYNVNLEDNRDFISWASLGGNRVHGSPQQESTSSQSWHSSLGGWLNVTEGQEYTLSIYPNSASTITSDNYNWMMAEFR